MRKIISETPKEVIIIITVFGWLSKIITVSKYYNLKNCVEQNYRIYPTDNLDTSNFNISTKQIWFKVFVNPVKATAKGRQTTKKIKQQ